MILFQLLYGNALLVTSDNPSYTPFLHCLPWRDHTLKNNSFSSVSTDIRQSANAVFTMYEDSVHVNPHHLVWNLYAFYW